MSFTDTMRSLSARLFDRFGTPATIVRPGTKTRDFVTGIITTTGGGSTAALAILGERELRADDGTVSVQSIAKSNRPAKAGDTLSIGAKTFKVGDVKEVSPDGGDPISYILVLA